MQCCSRCAETHHLGKPKDAKIVRRLSMEANEMQLALAKMRAEDASK